MGHLTYNHAVRKFGGVPLSTLDITAMQMVAVMNLTTFAWDCYDGQVRTEEQCDDSQKKSRITKVPHKTLQAASCPCESICEESQIALPAKGAASRQCASS